MSKKLTHEEFIARVIEKNDHVRNGEIEILGTYINQRTPIKCKCNIHNIEWDTWSDGLYMGRGCVLCGVDSANKHRIIPYEEFLNRTLKNNNLVKDGKIIILGEYHSMKSRIECKCAIHDIVWNPKASDLSNGCGCPECANNRIKHARLSTHDEFVDKLTTLNNGFQVLDTYINSSTPIRFQCPNGHSWFAEPNSILNGSGCPVCIGRQVLVGYNDIFTTHPHIAKLLKNPSDGYKYTYGSKENVEFVCPDCGKTSLRVIKNVCHAGHLPCDFCNDHISFPNKFIRAILSELNVNNMQNEFNPPWLRPYAFDVYFEDKNGHGIVVEMDGGIAHGNTVFGTKDIDIEGLKRDKEKDKRAIAHNICVIRIDCNYNDINDRFEYIKENIIKSKLSDIINLSGVNWEKCCLMALSSLVAKSAELYNVGYSVKDIAGKLGYCDTTIRSWLKQATKVGLCQYVPGTKKKTKTNILTIQN